MQSAVRTTSLYLELMYLLQKIEKCGAPFVRCGALPGRFRGVLFMYIMRSTSDFGENAAAFCLNPLDH